MKRGNERLNGAMHAAHPPLIASVSGENENDTLALLKIPPGYISGVDRSPEGKRKATHLYKGTFESPGLPMCPKGWNRGDGYSIWRNNISDYGLCRVCSRRAKQKLKGVPCPE